MNLFEETKEELSYEDMYEPHKDIRSTIPEAYIAKSKRGQIGYGESKYGPTPRSYDASSTIDGPRSSNKFYLSSLEFKRDLANQNVHRSHKNIKSKTPEENSVKSKLAQIDNRESEDGPTTRSYDASSSIDGPPLSNKFYLPSLEFKEDLANQNGHGSHENIKSKTLEEYSATSKINQIGDKASEHGQPTRLYDVSSTVNGNPSSNKLYHSSSELNGNLVNHNEHVSSKNIKSIAPEEYRATSKHDQIGDRPSEHGPTKRSHDASSTNNGPPSSNIFYKLSIKSFIYCHL